MAEINEKRLKKYPKVRNMLLEYNFKKQVDEILTLSVINGISLKDAMLNNASDEDVNNYLSSLEQTIVSLNKVRTIIIDEIQLYLNNSIKSHLAIIEVDKSANHVKGVNSALVAEIALKCLYTLCNIDSLDYISLRDELVNISESEYHHFIQQKIDDGWKIINKDKGKAQLEKAKQDTGILPSDLPESINGHSIIALIENLPEHIKGLVKYKIMTIIADLDLNKLQIPDEDDFITAKDLMLIFKDFNLEITESEITQINTDLVKRSNDYPDERYLVDHLKKDEVKFNISTALASLIVLSYGLENYKQHSKITVPSEYNCFSRVYSKKIDELLNSNNEKKAVLNDLSKHQFRNCVVSLSKQDFYNLINYYSYQEIDWMLNEVRNQPDNERPQAFRELFYYCTFFKQYTTKGTIKFDSDKYARINRLFDTIKKSNDISLLGYHFGQWFNTIDVKSLTPEELNVLAENDLSYVFDKLDYQSQIIYMQCKEQDIKFRLDYKNYYNKIDPRIKELYRGKKCCIPSYIIAVSYESLKTLLDEFEFSVEELNADKKPLIFAYSLDQIREYKNKNNTIKPLLGGIQPEYYNGYCKLDWWQFLNELKVSRSSPFLSKPIFSPSFSIDYISNIDHCYFTYDYETRKDILSQNGVLNLFPNDIKTIYSLPEYLFHMSKQTWHAYEIIFGTKFGEIINLPSTAFLLDYSSIMTIFNHEIVNKSIEMYKKLPPELFELIVWENYNAEDAFNILWVFDKAKAAPKKAGMVTMSPKELIHSVKIINSFLGKDLSEQYFSDYMLYCNSQKLNLLTLIQRVYLNNSLYRQLFQLDDMLEILKKPIEEIDTEEKINQVCVSMIPEILESKKNRENVNENTNRKKIA